MCATVMICSLADPWTDWTESARVPVEEDGTFLAAVGHRGLTTKKDPSRGLLACHFIIIRSAMDILFAIRPHTILECAFVAGHPICMIFDHYSTMLSEDVCNSSDT